MAGHRQEFLLPTVDEGAIRATVVRWLVELGDRVLVDRPVCLVDVGVDGGERLLELTSPFAGTIVALGAGTGDSLDAGEMLVTVEDGGGGQQHSPLVRRLAEEFGVDLGTVAGTGPAGRITRGDVHRAAFPDDPIPGADNGPEVDTDPAVTAAAAAPVSGDTGVSAPTAPTAEHGRAAEQQRLADLSSVPADTATRPDGLAQMSGPTFAVSATADAGQLLRAHERFAESAEGPVAVDALLVRIVSMAVRDLPLFGSVDAPAAVGFARLTDNRIVEATIAAPHDLPISELDQRMHQLTRAAQRDESPKKEPLPSITVVDAGALGMSMMTPLLTPGAAATIAIGRPEPRPWVVDGAVRNGWMVTATGSFDSSSVDVALASLLLRRIRLYVEDPILAFAS